MTSQEQALADTEKAMIAAGLALADHLQHLLPSSLFADENAFVEAVDQYRIAQADLLESRTLP